MDELLLRRKTMMGQKISPESVFEFSVSPTKKVIFSPGNLYWNGSEYKFETNEYDGPEDWDASHVGHFFWSKDASVARAMSYSDGSASTSDTFFAAIGITVRGYSETWTVLSSVEWGYVISNHMGKNQVSIAGKSCAVLVPDGVAASVVQSSYTATQWTAAKEQYGLVALPFSGYRDDSGVGSVGSYGSYWSTTPYDKYYAFSAYFFENGVGVYNDYRYYGESVRLVKAVGDAPMTITQYLLSKGYQTCEYLQSTGSQYINTGLVINSNDLRIKTTLTPTQLGNSSYNYEAGGAYGNNTRSMSIQMGYRTAYSGLGNADKQLSPSYSITANTEYEIDWHASDGQFTGTINGTSVSTSYSGSLASNQAYYLFAENSSGRAQNQGRFKIGRTQMWLSEVYERDFIPCYDVETNAGYMWDKLHDVFYPNVGSGSFTIGNDIIISETYEG